MKTKICIILLVALVSGTFGLHTASAQLMYHDFGANSSGTASTGNITTHQIGNTAPMALDTSVKNLIDYNDGSATGVSLQVTANSSGRGVVAFNGRLGDTRAPLDGTPADPLFNVPGLALSDGILYCGYGDTYTLTISGLDTNLLYDLAFYGDRALGADGVERFTLGGADSELNISSTGIFNSTTTDLGGRGHVSTFNIDGRLRI